MTIAIPPGVYLLALYLELREKHDIEINWESHIHREHTAGWKKDFLFIFFIFFKKAERQTGNESSILIAPSTFDSMSALALTPPSPGLSSLVHQK